MKLMPAIRSLVIPAGLLLALASPSFGGTVRLGWSPVPGATGYNVYYGTESRDYTHVVDFGSSAGGELHGLEDCTTYYVAVKAYDQKGEALEYSNEVSGWPRPEVSSPQPVDAMQGTQLILNIAGTNFEPGAELLLHPAEPATDIAGNALVRVESVSVQSCNQLQVLLTVEAMGRGSRAMPVGEMPIELEVRNPDSVFGSGSAMLEVRFNPLRSDINRSDFSTRDRVDGKDLIWLGHAYGSREGDPRFGADADLNGDGLVDGEDLAYLGTAFGMCWNGSAWSANACR